MTKRKLNIHSACYHFCHSAVPGTFSKSTHRAAGKKNIITNKRRADTENNIPEQLRHLGGTLHKKLSFLEDTSGYLTTK